MVQATSGPAEAPIGHHALPSVALSVRQPWGWAIIFGGKNIENRGHDAVIKGKMKPRRIAIHASKGMTRDEYEDGRDFMQSLGVACPLPADLVRGAVIGCVEVVEIVSKSQSPWFFGPRGLVLRNAQACAPIAASGALGYFEWEPGGEIELPLKWMLAGTPKTIAPSSAANPQQQFDLPR